MNKSPIITRFAPSPTGTTHIGGIRTALFNYLFSKNQGGKFLLRIEDTDQKRLVDGAVDNLLTSMKWSNLDFDIGPTYQSSRTEIYKEHADILLDQGLAYPCFCDSHRLESIREKQAKRGLATSYDRHCLVNYTAQERKDMMKSELFTVRQLIPTNRKIIHVEDVVHGTVLFRPKQINDQILLKTDSFPTYHLANVVDDHLMGITHVIRGEEWLTSTPKHLLLYEAFGWTPPVYAHVPLLLDANKNKLSKRTGSGPGISHNSHGFPFPFHSADPNFDLSLTPNIETISRAGFLPEALLNFLALLGWYPGTSQEFFTRQDLISKFSLSGFNNSNSIVDWKKLVWFNEQHFKSMANSASGSSDLETHFLGYLRNLHEWLETELVVPLVSEDVVSHPDFQVVKALSKISSLDDLFISNLTIHSPLLSSIQSHPHFQSGEKFNNINYNSSTRLAVAFQISCDRVSTFEDYVVINRHSYLFYSPYNSLQWNTDWDPPKKVGKIPRDICIQAIESIIFLLADVEQEYASAAFVFDPTVKSNISPFGEIVMNKLLALVSDQYTTINKGTLLSFIRYLITGTHGGPHLGSIIHVIGFPETCNRLIAGLYTYKYKS